MKFNLKALFTITFVVALLVSCVMSDRIALYKVSLIKSGIEQALSKYNNSSKFKVSRSEHRNEFILFSSGDVVWNVKAVEPKLKIRLNWKSRLFFGQEPTVELINRGSNDVESTGKEIATALREQGVAVVESNDAG